MDKWSNNGAVVVHDDADGQDAIIDTANNNEDALFLLQL